MTYQNCRFSRFAINGWQYGQSFPTGVFFKKQREFLVDPIECHEQAIVVNASPDEKTFRTADTGVGIHIFMKRKCPDDISENEFKYRIKCSDKGKWTCTCEHFKNNKEKCCKHINACIDATLWEKEHDNLIINERGLNWRPKTTTYDFGNGIRYTYPGYTEIVTKMEPTQVQENAESQFHQYVSGQSFHDFSKPLNSINYHSFNK